MSTQPSATISAAATAALRPADTVLSPADMGGARYTRHSFARTLLRTASVNGWKVRRELFDIDAAGRGTAVYRIGAGAHVWRFVAFSRTIAEADRTDRVIAQAWDVAGALVEGDLDSARLENLRAEVPQQEHGRADQGTVIWTRANRSARFFDYVVGRLAAGEQPEADVFAGAPYLLRSTAFYSNGKFGLADFERFEPGHPFAVPYRAHMLTAWLVREFSYDLVEHCAAARNPRAAVLDAAWRRYLGLGNATGLGMVPYVVNHPQVLDAWARLRELPLAVMVTREVRPQDPDVARVLALLDRAMAYLRGQAGLVTAPYADGPTVALMVAEIAALAREFATVGTIGGQATTRPWAVLHDKAQQVGTECRGIVATVLVELATEVDEVVENSLRREENVHLDARMTCGQLLEMIDSSYSWVGEFDFTDDDQTHHFWFSSVNNEEPRRALRGSDPGEQVQHGVDVARTVSALRAAIVDRDLGESVAALMLAEPQLRGAATRVQQVGRLQYGEVRDNLLGRSFLPLHVQRFQLAVYGMENYSPQSTDWLRVTLFSGAPRASDVNNGTADDDWIFVTPPERTTDVPA